MLVVDELIRAALRPEFDEAARLELKKNSELATDFLLSERGEALCADHPMKSTLISFLDCSKFLG
jgi:hypothetical protein